MPKSAIVLLLCLAGCATALMCAAALSFDRVEIDAAAPQNPWIKAAGDLDGDSKADVVIGGSKGLLVWYRNPSHRRLPEDGVAHVAPDSPRPADREFQESGWTSRS
jgi:hypothetical protein